MLLMLCPGRNGDFLKDCYMQLINFFLDFRRSRSEILAVLEKKIFYPHKLIFLFLNDQLQKSNYS